MDEQCGTCRKPLIDHQNQRGEYRCCNDVMMRQNAMRVVLLAEYVNVFTGPQFRGDKGQVVISQAGERSVATVYGLACLIFEG